MGAQVKQQLGPKENIVKADYLAVSPKSPCNVLVTSDLRGILTFIKITQSVIFSLASCFKKMRTRFGLEFSLMYVPSFGSQSLQHLSLKQYIYVLQLWL